MLADPREAEALLEVGQVGGLQLDIAGVELDPVGLGLAQDPSLAQLRCGAVGVVAAPGVAAAAADLVGVAVVHDPLGVGLADPQVAQLVHVQLGQVHAASPVEHLGAALGAQ